MFKLIGPAIVLVSSFYSIHLFADDKPNILVQSCSQASSQTIRVTNENGQCNAYWKCDGKEFKVFCDGSNCKCYYYDWGEHYFQGYYQSCDSDVLKECYAQ